MLDQHPMISMAIDPFLPLFRYYRDSLIRAAGLQNISDHISRSALDDYYFSDSKLQIMRAVADVDPDIPFDEAGWESVRPELISRLTLTSLNLLPRIDELLAPTFKEVFENCIRIVSQRKNTSVVWAGFNDNWAAEFMIPLARLFPDAKFILHLRDPRGVVNSSEFAEPDPRKRPTITSFCRHLRKYMALSLILPEHPALQGRILITYYEKLLTNTREQLEKILDFLGLEFRTEMLDVTRFRRGDGSKPEATWSIYQDSASIWQQEMPLEMAELVEFICSPDMQICGYDPEIYNFSKGLSADAFDFAVANVHSCLGWRTDFQEIEHNIGCELFRQRMLRSASIFTEGEIKRSFLSPEIFYRLKSHVN